MTVFSLLEAAAHFKHLGHTVHQANHAALEIAARIVEAEAKRLIGSHDAGWPALKPETIARKTTGDSPLLETGELRDSITHSSSPTEARVGSNLDRAVWHELGTRTVPPRPFLSTALRNKEKVITRAVGEVIKDYLMAGRMEADLFSFALKALHKIAHELGEAAHDLLDEPDQDKHRK
jgi:HK97 gp10 family phage protein